MNPIKTIIEHEQNEQENQHPKAVEARKRSLANQAERALVLTAKKRTLQNLTEEHKLHFIDITPAPYRATSGMTVAYQGNRVLRVSLATRNPNDAYSRLEGRLTAAESFDNGNWVYMRRPSGAKIGSFLRAIFDH